MAPLLNTFLFSPLLLLTLSIQDPTEACSCLPAHPQEQFCSSDIVIHAYTWSKKEVIDSASSLKIIRYEIKQIKMFKGFENTKDVRYVFTPLAPEMCGVHLIVNNSKKNEYLLSGNISPDGRLFIYFCDFIKPWKDLTHSEKENLNKNFEMGCDCTITACPREPCSIATPNKCLWTDWLKEQRVYGHQAHNSACFKGSDGTCSWH